MSQPVYKTQFKEKLHFSPFEGTLNIKIGEKEIDDIHKAPEDKIMKIEGKENFGDVLVLKAVLNDKIEGAIVFPKRTTHGENILEFIASKNVKEELSIKDDDSVKITLEY
jgi:riboflavin kinase